MMTTMPWHLSKDGGDEEAEEEEEECGGPVGDTISILKQRRRETLGY